MSEEKSPKLRIKKQIFLPDKKIVEKFLTEMEDIYKVIDKSMKGLLEALYRLNQTIAKVKKK